MISKEVALFVDQHDAALLLHAVVDRMANAERELHAIRRYISGDEYRCCLPCSLANETMETIKESVDPWISLVDHYKDMADRLVVLNSKFIQGAG